jgi:hypothetical protein
MDDEGMKAPPEVYSLSDMIETLYMLVLFFPVDVHDPSLQAAARALQVPQIFREYSANSANSANVSASSDQMERSCDEMTIGLQGVLAKVLHPNVATAGTNPLVQAIVQQLLAAVMASTGSLKSQSPPPGGNIPPLDK